MAGKASHFKLILILLIASFTPQRRTTSVAIARGTRRAMKNSLRRTAREPIATIPCQEWYEIVGFSLDRVNRIRPLYYILLYKYIYYCSSILLVVYYIIIYSIYIYWPIIFYYTRPTSTAIRSAQLELLGKTINDPGKKYLRDVAFDGDTLTPRTARSMRRVGRPRHNWTDQLLQIISTT